ncbi:Derlin [Entamoeba marina]
MTQNNQQPPESPFLEFFYSIPLVTRILLVTTLSFSVSSSFYRPIAEVSYFDPYLITENYHLWRLVTPFFLQKLGFPFLMHLFMLFNFSKELEQVYFQGNSKDYAFYLAFIAGLINTCSVALGMPLHQSLMNCIVYTSCRAQPNAIITLFFGITLRRMYLPWALILLNMLMGAPMLPQLLSILIAHMYYFCRHVVPNHYPNAPRLI